MKGIQPLQERTGGATGPVVQTEVMEDLNKPLLAQSCPIECGIMIGPQQMMSGLPDNAVILFGRESAQEFNAGEAMFFEGRQEGNDNIGYHRGDTTGTRQ